MNITTQKKAFIFPIVVGLIALLMTMSSVVFFGVVSKLANYSRTATCGLRARYAAEAAISDVTNANLSFLATNPSCTAGMYVIPNMNTCALPGAAGSVVTLDSSCNYSAQIISLSTSSANILATGRCNLDECAGSGGSIVQLNSTTSASCLPSCNGVNCGAGFSDGCGADCGCVSPKVCGAITPNLCN
ncbi:MAG: hypothetical protein WCO55_04140 [Candidatus Falkowbacteria bacterium]